MEKILEAAGKFDDISFEIDKARALAYLLWDSIQHSPNAINEKLHGTGAYTLLELVEHVADEMEEAIILLAEARKELDGGGAV